MILKLFLLPLLFFFFGLLRSLLGAAGTWKTWGAEVDGGSQDTPGGSDRVSAVRLSGQNCRSRQGAGRYNTDESIGHLDSLIAEHRHRFCGLFPEGKFIPKHHFVEHYPQLINPACRSAGGG